MSAIRVIQFTDPHLFGDAAGTLRGVNTLETLERLAKGGWIAEEAAKDLSEAYLFLRRIENRLQMVGDQQTHTIPAERDELDRVARLSGYDDTNAFGDALLAQFKRVETHYANHAFIGLFVPKGKHKLRIVFHPEAFTRGRNVTLATIGALVAFFVLRHRLQKPRAVRV